MVGRCEDTFNLDVFIHCVRKRFELLEVHITTKELWQTPPYPCYLCNALRYGQDYLIRHFFDVITHNHRPWTILHCLCKSLQSFFLDMKSVYNVFCRNISRCSYLNTISIFLALFSVFLSSFSIKLLISKLSIIICAGASAFK